MIPFNRQRKFFMLYNAKIPEALIDFLELVPCDLCGRNDFEILYPSLYTEDSFTADRAKSFMYASEDKTRGNIVRCRQCGLVYANPRDKDISAIYCTVGEDNYYFFSREDRLATSENDYNHLEEVASQQVIKRGKILDVGCSYGFFMDVAKNHGWDVYGCELSKKQSSFARQRHINVFNQELKFCPFEKDYFDVITLFDVIEHLASPSSFLMEAKSFLKPGGLLVVCTPDLSSFPARLMGRYWLNFVRMHLYYFTPKTISRLFVKSGFQVLKITRHRRIIKLGVAVEWMKKYPWLYRPLKFFLDNPLLKRVRVSCGLSGNMTVYAKKI